MTKAWTFELHGREDRVTIRLVEFIERLSHADDATDKHYGLFIWPSAMVLARFVAFHHERLFRGATVMELGCGTALPEANIALNDVQATASFLPLDWGSLDLVERVNELAQVDIILAADCFYQSKDFESVLATVAIVFRCNPDARFFTTYQLRRYRFPFLRTQREYTR
ncbi:hypothetical protein PINS_up011384 [Pythium insidiosum]|nr:hypothetical protein PINS_up011384 [Pythium insidiosum]